MRKLPIGRAVERGERFSTHDVKRAWAERRRAIVAFYEQSGNATLTGDVFGISSQRVMQIVKRVRRLG